jgi:hypothetical protein
MEYLGDNVTISLGLERRAVRRAALAHVGRWWWRWRGGDVMVIPSHPENAPGRSSGGCLPHAPRVSPSSPPDLATTLSSVTRATPRPGPRDQRDRDRSSSLRSGSSSCPAVGPALVPFLLPLLLLLLPAYPSSSSVLPSNRRQGQS